MKFHLHVGRDGSSHPENAGDVRALGLSALLGAGGTAIPASLWGAALPAGITGGVLLAAYVGAAIYMSRRERKKYAPIAEEMAHQEFRAALEHPACEGMLLAHYSKSKGWEVRDLDGEIKSLDEEGWKAWKRGADKTDVPLLTIRAATIIQDHTLNRSTRDNVVVVERSVQGTPMGTSGEDPSMRATDPRTGEVMLNWTKQNGRDDTAGHHGLLAVETISKFQEMGAETRKVGTGLPHGEHTTLHETGEKRHESMLMPILP